MKTIKTLSAVSAFFLIAVVGFSQKEDINVFEKKEGSKIIVMARNTGKVDYSVSLEIKSTGMEVSPSTKVEKVIQPGFMKEMAYLIPKAGESWEYSYDVSFEKSTGKKITQLKEPEFQETQVAPSSTKPTPPPTPPTPVLTQVNIVLYTKPGCGRCAFVKKQLTSLGIAFEEYSTASESPEINNMWAALRNSGFEGGSVTMPVVRAEGKYYYNIPDLNGFVTNLKK